MMTDPKTPGTPSVAAASAAVPLQSAVENTASAAEQVKRETVDTTSADGSHVRKDFVTPTFNVESGESDKQRTFIAYRAVVEVVIYALVAYFVLLWLRVPFADKFATIVVAPVLTVFAGAAGYFFGSRQTK